MRRYLDGLQMERTQGEVRAARQFASDLDISYGAGLRIACGLDPLPLLRCKTEKMGDFWTEQPRTLTLWGFERWGNVASPSLTMRNMPDSRLLYPVTPAGEVRSVFSKDYLLML